MWHVTYDSSYSGGTRLEKVLTRQQIIRFYYASPSFSNKETAFIVFKYGRKTLSHILESEFEFLLSGATTYSRSFLELFCPNRLEFPIVIQGHWRSLSVADFRFSPTRFGNRSTGMVRELLATHASKKNCSIIFKPSAKKHRFLTSFLTTLH